MSRPRRVKLKMASIVVVFLNAHGSRVEHPTSFKHIGDAILRYRKEEVYTCTSKKAAKRLIISFFNNEMGESTIVRDRRAQAHVTKAVANTIARFLLAAGCSVCIRSRPSMEITSFVADKVKSFLLAAGYPVEPHPVRYFKQIGGAIIQYLKIDTSCVTQDEVEELIIKFAIECDLTKKSQSAHSKSPSDHPKSSKYTDDYIAHLRSPEWRVFKTGIIHARGSICERCGAQGESVCIDLHHLTYIRLGHEKPQDVKLLCRSCHQDMHPGNTLRTVQAHVVKNRNQYN